MEVNDSVFELKASKSEVTSVWLWMTASKSLKSAAIEIKINVTGIHFDWFSNETNLTPSFESGLPSLINIGCSGSVFEYSSPRAVDPEGRAVSVTVTGHESNKFIKLVLNPNNSFTLKIMTDLILTQPPAIVLTIKLSDGSKTNSFKVQLQFDSSCSGRLQDLELKLLHLYYDDATAANESMTGFEMIQ